VTRIGWRWLAAAAVGLLASGCGGGGGGGGGGGPPANVTLSGTVTFDFVPTGNGLDYGQTQPRPVRGATVEIVSAGAVLTTTKTGTTGSYSVSVPTNRSLFVRVKAQMQQAGSPSWDFRVLDNTNGDALYALDGPESSTGTAASTRDLHAPSGWGGASYMSERAAAPFAILDTVYEAVALVLAADPALSFPALNLYWSTENRPVLPTDGIPDRTTGEIGTSFFLPGNGIYLLGAENVDTEEYDRHVVVHEWGHYFEDELSRSDSIGGRHTRHDQLDLRTAFSEGLSNALSGIALADSLYRDTSGPQQGSSFGFDIEGPPLLSPNLNPGWFSEESIQEIVYDLVDANPDPPDQLDMDFAAVYAALRSGGHRDSIALTSIFSFIDALKTSNGADAPSIDAIVNGQAIDNIVDGYGSGETNGGGTLSGDVLPVYETIDVNGPAVNVCSTDEFQSSTTGSGNKLASRRYLRFSVGTGVTHTFTAVATDIPSGEVADPDLVLHQAGVLQVSEEAPGPTCSDVTPFNCIETFQRVMTPGDYVLEVYEWTNTQDDVPPIGRTCFDITVTQL
jgi:hypothetical protein